MESREKLIAKDLLSIRAVFFRPDEPFTWASGIKSPVYCDNRLTLTAPEVRNDVENALAAVVAHYQKYIRALATRPVKDEYGNEYLYVDEDMRLRLETKLIHSIVTSFKVLPV